MFKDDPQYLAGVGRTRHINPKNIEKLGTLHDHKTLSKILPDASDNTLKLLSHLIEDESGRAKLFDVDIGLEKTLNERLPDGSDRQKLRKIFKDNGYDLSEDIGIFVGKNNSWIILDTYKKAYILRKMDNHIEVRHKRYDPSIRRAFDRIYDPVLQRLKQKFVDSINLPSKESDIVIYLEFSADGLTRFYRVKRSRRDYTQKKESRESIIYSILYQSLGDSIDRPMFEFNLIEYLSLAEIKKALEGIYIPIYHRLKKSELNKPSHKYIPYDNI